ncbi:MAG: RnfABCDGE type electron transport complex subunit B [Gammaproteobacteria bacterium]|nr:MAG: RnfABCDGE type electron transport complex subunit B [Gammaproteobacteria bacterium]
MNPSGSEDALKPSSADGIDALLPQTQCIQCGFPSCREYAEAMVAGQADLNRCPPGGTMTIAALALSLGLAPKALDPACGEQRPWVVARIDEAVCIGCTLCIQACPVDAILGAAKRMHTVIESECTGCELCLDPCPVDCIDLAPTRWHAKVADSFLEGWMRERAPLARRRFHARRQRQLQLRQARGERRRLKKPAAMPGRDADRATKQAVIRGAVERARHRRRGAHG